MAITSQLIASVGRSIYEYKIRSYTGPLSAFSSVDSGYDPNSTYLVGYIFDASDGNRGSMTANGTLINDSHTAGAGSWRKATGFGIIAVGNGGLISWSGGGTTSVSGGLRTFTVRIR